MRLATARQAAASISGASDASGSKLLEADAEPPPSAAPTLAVSAARSCATLSRDARATPSTASRNAETS